MVTRFVYTHEHRQLCYNFPYYWGVRICNKKKTHNRLVRICVPNTRDIVMVINRIDIGFLPFSRLCMSKKQSVKGLH